MHRQQARGRHCLVILVPGPCPSLGWGLGELFCVSLISDGIRTHSGLMSSSNVCFSGCVFCFPATETLS